MELVNDLQQGIFTELNSEPCPDRAAARELQRHYIDILKKEFDAAQPAGGGGGGLGGKGGNVSELRAVARAALRDLSSRMGELCQRAQDPATRAHLEDCVSEIDLALTTTKKKS